MVQLKMHSPRANTGKFRLVVVFLLVVATLFFTILGSPSVYSSPSLEVAYLEFNNPRKYESIVTLQIPNVDPCPHAQRLGAEGAEGGWLVCNNQRQQQKDSKCIVYSIGIKDDFSFDQAIHNSNLYPSTCEVHGFDPSPYGLKSKPKYQAIGPRAHYHSMGLGTTDGVAEPGTAPFRWPGIGYMRYTNTAPWILKRIPTIMKELGHSQVSHLKVDAEGAEWDAIPDIVASTQWTEFAVEMHFPPKEYVLHNIKPTKDDKDGAISAQAVIVARWKDRKYQEPSARPPWLDRLRLLRELQRVADVWKIEPNPTDKHCLNVYFVRK